MQEYAKIRIQIQNEGKKISILLALSIIVSFCFQIIGNLLFHLGVINLQHF